MRTWLADIRKGANKTQQNVASAAGISQAYYAEIELGIQGKPLTVRIKQTDIVNYCGDLRGVIV